MLCFHFVGTLAVRVFRDLTTGILVHFDVKTGQSLRSEMA